MSQSFAATSTPSVVGVVFVILKLCHVIAWSWWWVTLPFWGPSAICLTFAGIILLMMAIATAITKAATK